MTCGHGEPVSPELIHEAAVDVRIRCQVVVIAWSSLLRAKQCVCAGRVCSCGHNAPMPTFFTNITKRRIATVFQIQRAL